MPTKDIDRFGQLLHDANPDAGNHVLALARNSFLRRYGSYSVPMELALAVATEEELLQIRNAGKKCQHVYANAQKSARANYDWIRDILELKEAMYAVVDPNKRWISGIDILVLQCIEHDVCSKKQYDVRMAGLLAYRIANMWDGRDTILGKAYIAITRQLHPNVDDPHTYIVRYVDDDAETIYTGISPVKGKQILVGKLSKAGYNVNVSGCIGGLPIHFVNAMKKDGENHEKDD